EERKRVVYHFPDRIDGDPEPLPPPADCPACRECWIRKPAPEDRPMSQPEPPPAAKSALPQWVSLRKPLSALPLPPEWAARLEPAPRNARLRRCGEEDVKLQLYFGGWNVYTLDENGGRTVVALVRRGSHTRGTALDHLTPEERRQVTVCFPDRIDGDPEPLP